MKDDFIEAHRSSALKLTATLFLILGAADLIYGALAGRHLNFAGGALWFVASILSFEAAKPNSR
jgi:hypothetical protein